MSVQVYYRKSCAFLHRFSPTYLFRQSGKNSRSFLKCTSHGAISYRCFAQHSKHIEFNLEEEMQQARKEARPYRIDRSKLSDLEKQKLRARSKSIPLVADKEPLEIVYEDENFLVVNKPSFIKMHPSHRFEGGSLLNRAIGYCGFPPFLVHRLDMHTTGVVVFAKKKKLCQPIMHQFMSGMVKKEYLCLVDGLREESVGFTFWVDAPIQRHPTVSFVREVGNSHPDSKPSKTKFTILDKSEEKNMMLLHAAPATGRTHQIRVHASDSSIPIVGDDLYNPTEHKMYDSYEQISAAAKRPDLTRYGNENPLRKGLKLHAWKIHLRNPENRLPVTFCANPPDHMTRLLEWSGMQLPSGLNKVKS